MKKTDNYGNLFSVNGIPASRQMVWDDTRAFLAVARHGTLTGAAAALNLGVATLSRRIERLEFALDLPLFVRQQTGYVLTEEGAALVEKAEAMETAAHALTSDANARTSLTGHIRLATAENLATGLILPALAEFRDQYPGLSIELVTDIATANIHRRDADLALRMVKPERGNVRPRQLGILGYGLYASPTYLATRDKAHTAHDYAADAFITWGEAHSHLPAAQWIERALEGRQPALTTTTLATQITAAKAGLGLAVLPHFLAADAGLTCVEPDIGVSQPIYLVIQADLTRSRRILALADFLSDLVTQNADQLGG